jgi:hypothetical protein
VSVSHESEQPWTGRLLLPEFRPNAFSGLLRSVPELQRIDVDGPFIADTLPKALSAALILFASCRSFFNGRIAPASSAIR